MKLLVVISVCVAVALSQKTTTIPAKPSTRMLKADVLRDFPGACFGSTLCRVFPVGQSWQLTPFCGNSTCINDKGNLMEQVKDCGPTPKNSPGCRVTNEADLKKAFPTCCPVYECQEGATLQYPTPEEIAAAAAAARAAASAAASNSNSNTSSA